MKGQKPDYDAYNIVELGTDAEGNPRTRWNAVGIAFTNRDGSINVQLNAVPLSGRLQLRVPKPKEEVAPDTELDDIPF